MTRRDMLAQLVAADLNIPEAVVRKIFVRLSEICEVSPKDFDVPIPSNHLQLNWQLMQERVPSVRWLINEFFSFNNSQLN